MNLHSRNLMHVEVLQTFPPTETAIWKAQWRNNGEILIQTVRLKESSTNAL